MTSVENKANRQKAQCEKQKDSFKKIFDMSKEEFISEKFDNFYEETSKDNKTFGMFTTPDMFVKAAYGKNMQEYSLRTDCSDFYSYNYELQVYDKIIPKIVYYSPNFIQGKYIIFKRGEKGFEIFETLLNNRMKNIHETFSGCDKNVIYVIILKRMFEAKVKEAPEIFLKSEFTNNALFILKLTKENFRKICAQIILTLSVMFLFGFVHNDLHINNFLFEELEVSEDLHYHLGNDVYITIPDVKYKLNFFDWDMSYVKELGDNLHLQNFTCDAPYNICSGYHLANDFAKFLFTLRYNIYRADELANHSPKPLRIDTDISDGQKDYYERKFPDFFRFYYFATANGAKNIESKLDSENYFYVNNKIKRSESEKFFPDEDEPDKFFKRIINHEYISGVIQM